MESLSIYGMQSAQPSNPCQSVVTCLHKAEHALTSNEASLAPCLVDQSCCPVEQSFAIITRCKACHPRICACSFGAVCALAERRMGWRRVAGIHGNRRVSDTLEYRTPVRYGIHLATRSVLILNSRNRRCRRVFLLAFAGEQSIDFVQDIAALRAGSGSLLLILAFPTFYKHSTHSSPWD